MRVPDGRVRVRRDVGAIGASATGARAYTATASQGLLYMAEALYNASGLGLPIVMTVANRAIGAPINIWNDHSDSMSQRDSGWIQLYAESNQEAVDLHVQAFRLAEELSLPVMVCMDGFILTHAFEPVDIPSQEQVDAFLPPFEPRQVLDPDDPMTIGAMVGPEAFTEVRYLMHAKQMQALDVDPRDRRRRSRRPSAASSGGLVRSYRSADAETIVVALGSVLGTIEDVVDELREQGVRIGAVGIKCFRPFPLEELRAALGGARRVDRDREGLRGRASAASSARTCGSRRGHRRARATTWSRASAAGRSRSARCTRSSPTSSTDRLEPGRLHFLDLDRELVERELRRTQESRRSGPHAENILRDLGVVAARAALKGRSRAATADQVLPGRELRGRQPAARPRPALGAGRRASASNTITSGHRACQGCGEALGARYALDAAMRATDGRLIAANATGCLEVFSTPYPESSWQLPWLHSLFGNAPAVATGIAAALEGEGPDRRPRDRPGRRRRDDGHRLRAASRGCSSATTTCSTSVTTTRAT